MGRPPPSRARRSSARSPGRPSYRSRSCTRVARAQAEQLAGARTLQDELRQGVGRDALLRVEVGHPEARLIEASRRASLLVIATRGGGAVRLALSGSVTSTVTRFAAALVLVVTRRALKDGAARLGAGAMVCAIRDERDLACAATAGVALLLPVDRGFARWDLPARLRDRGGEDARVAIFVRLQDQTADTRGHTPGASYEVGRWSRNCHR